MKWLGQYIQDLPSRFRDDVYLEGTSLYAGSDGTGTLAIIAGDLTMYNDVTDGDPVISIGSSATERFGIIANYGTSTKTLQQLFFRTYTASGIANYGGFVFSPNEVNTVAIDDGGMDLYANKGISINGTDILTDSSGTATLSNIDALDATTETTIETAIDTLSNLTTTGTIGTGVWQGTAVATDQQKHLAWFTVKGFSTGNGTNYEVPANLDDDDGPWKHNISTGSDGLTALGIANIVRIGGIVAPRAGTLKRWTGWTTTAGSSTANIALFKITPTRNNNSDVAPVLLDNVAYTALGNTKMEDFDETSFTDADIAAGDIITSGILCENNKTTYFDSTLEIEWD